MSRRLTLICAAKLHANQLERHLELFEYLPEVERVIVVRHAAVPERLSKVENRSFGDGSRVLSAARMIHQVRRIAREESADWVIGFNPVPWGSLAALSAKSVGVPSCLCLIGMDFLQVQKWWGRPFLEAVKSADAVTVTGRRMTDGLVRAGASAEKIRVLPHSVDTARFAPRAGEPAYDIVSVGQLIQRKRMDVLIDALGLLKKQGVQLRAAILGRGPLEEALRDRARTQGVSEQVDFLGYRDDVEQVISQAGIFCLASEWEGVPFAMMEAMAAGLVPVVTDVGTIADWVTPGENGCIVPVGDHVALAATLKQLHAENGALRNRFRAQLIAERERLSFAQGAQVWREIFKLDA